jgi:hypothetical protein
MGFLNQFILQKTPDNTRSYLRATQPKDKRPLPESDLEALPDD